jgi:hypothetical protein
MTMASPPHAPAQAPLFAFPCDRYLLRFDTFEGWKELGTSLRVV